MATTTPDLHSNPWGLVVLPRPLRLTLHLGARHFLNASIASDAFDSTYQNHETTDGLQSTKNCKVHPNQLHQTEHHAFTTCSPRVPLRVSHVFPRVSHVFTTCLPRVHHVFTTCLPRVTTCLPRVHHVFTTCSPRVHHVFITCSPRVHHLFTTCRTWFGEPSNREDEGVVDRDHFYVQQHESRAFQCDRTILCATVPEWFTDSQQKHKPCRPLTRSSNPGR